MTIIIINGAPGSGKTTVAFKLADRLGVEQVIQTDTLKDFFKINKYPEIAFSTSHEAWKFMGEKNNFNIIKGFNAHSLFFEELLAEMINLAHESGKTIIVEGVHATPKLFSSINHKDKIGFFLNVDETTRNKRYDLKNAKRQRKNSNWQNNSEIISLIGDYLLEESKKNGMIVVDNLEIDNSIKIMEESVNKNDF